MQSNSFSSTFSLLNDNKKRKIIGRFESNSEVFNVKTDQKFNIKVRHFFPSKKLNNNSKSCSKETRNKNPKKKKKFTNFNLHLYFFLIKFYD